LLFILKLFFFFNYFQPYRDQGRLLQEIKMKLLRKGLKEREGIKRKKKRKRKKKEVVVIDRQGKRDR